MRHYNDHKDEAALESIVKMIISINHKDDHKDEFSKGLATKRKAKRYWLRELGCWPPIGQFFHQSSVDSFACKRSCLGS